MSRLPNTEQLEVFCTVCELKQLNLVAQKLGISPSAVSQSLRKLESDLEQELFYHNERPLRLTPTGRRLLAESRPIIEALKSLDRTFRSIDTPTSLRLGMGETITATLSPWIVSTLYGKVGELEIQSSLNAPLIEKLRARELDVCIISDGLLSESQWVRIPVFEEDYLVIASQAQSEVETLQDLRDLALKSPFVSYTNESLDRRQADQFLHSVGIEPRCRIQTSSSFCLVGLVDQVAGWSLLPATNIWSSRDFAQKVHIWTLPTQTTLTRRMWVVGAPDREDEVRTLAKLTRDLFLTHTVPELKRISPVLTNHARVLPQNF